MVVVANELGDLCTRMWRSLGGAADVAEVLTASGPRAVLPAYFDVTGLATASVACATLAAAEPLEDLLLSFGGENRHEHGIRKRS